MSRRTDLRRDVQASIGNFPSLAKIDKYIEKRHGTAVKLMAGIEPYQDGRAKRYYAGDVADAILDSKLVL